MLDDRTHNFRERMQPAWDDLRERRLLRNIRRRLEHRRTQSAVRRRALSIATRAALGIAALLVVYVAGVDLGKRLALRRPSPPPVATGEAKQPAAPAAGDGMEIAEARMLSDGSRLELSRSARVEVRTETNSRVEVAQTGGRVRYDVARVPTRVFVIHAGTARVEVIGTIFVVSFEGDNIAIHVERGRVRVSGKGKETELEAGDELSFSAQEAPPVESASPPQPAVRREPVHATSVSALLERADAERAAGDLAAAVATLREVVTRNPSDPRTALGWFTLGKVERTRARAVVAARAFRTSFWLAPDGPLAEDALAEEAAAWAAANDAAEAREAVERYLRRFPNGTHAARVRHLLE
jgi:transmembrane sensor